MTHVSLDIQIPYYCFIACLDFLLKFSLTSSFTFVWTIGHDKKNSVDKWDES